MRSTALMIGLALAATLATPASAWRGGGGGGWGGGAYHGGGGDDFHGDSGWHDSAGGADWYHGANGGAYRPPQMTDTGYKPPAAYAPGTDYHPPMAATGYHYPAPVYGYPHGYYGYGYHPYSAWGAAGVVAAATVVGIAAANTATYNAAYPYGVVYAYPYAYGYTAPMVYTINCGGIGQPICATPTQMWSQSYANTAAAGDAIMAAALAAN